MKAHRRNGIRIMVASTCTIAVAIGALAVRAKADAWDKKTILTVNQPIQVEETYLDSGTYVLKLLESNSNRHVVQIFNQDQSHLINTVMAIPNYRLQPTGGSRFSFYETPPGTARAMRAWFYPGDNFGQEFRYPKELRQIAMAVPAATTRPPEPPPPPIVTEPAKEEPRATVVTEPVAPEPEEPVQIAQAAPPPPPQGQTEPVREAPAADVPRELPQTATPYPMIGLGGVLLLGLYGFSRMRSMT